jgi:hypothetical protein
MERVTVHQYYNFYEEYSRTTTPSYKKEMPGSFEQGIKQISVLQLI